MRQLLIFDCDGVLVDSEIIANRVDAEALRSLGYPLTAEESVRRFTGMNSQTIRQLIFEQAGVTLPADFFQKQEEAILQAFEKELSPLLEPLLTLIQEQNISRCVASSSSRSRVLHSLTLTNQRRFFDDASIFTSQQVAKGKPAPDLFLLAASQMGFAPERCLVIEDSLAGIQAALAARMPVIGFLGGSHAQYDWYQEKVHSYKIPIANTYEELQDFLFGN